MTVLASFPARLASFVGIEFVSCTLLMCRFAAFTGYLPLFVCVHRSKATVAYATLLVAILVLIRSHIPPENVHNLRNLPLVNFAPH
jgi:hypothetical protein